MLVAILILLSVLLWGSMIGVYFRAEIFAWYDNRFGPDRTRPPKPRKKPFWQIYD